MATPIDLLHRLQESPPTTASGDMLRAIAEFDLDALQRDINPPLGYGRDWWCGRVPAHGNVTV